MIRVQYSISSSSTSIPCKVLQSHLADLGPLALLPHEAAHAWGSQGVNDQTSVQLKQPNSAINELRLGCNQLHSLHQGTPPFQSFLDDMVNLLAGANGLLDIVNKLSAHVHPAFVQVQAEISMKNKFGPCGLQGLYPRATGDASQLYIGELLESLPGSIISRISAQQ